MKTPLAWKNLTHHRFRTVVAVLGISFANILLFMQLGFLGVTYNTASQIYSALEFDIALRSPDYLHLSLPRTFPEKRLSQAQDVAGVQRVTPFHSEMNFWQNPKKRSQRAMLVMAVDPTNHAFKDPEIVQGAKQLNVHDLVLIDRRSHIDFGPKGRRFGDEDIGVHTRLGVAPVRIAGHFSLGAGMAADGAAIVSQRGFRRLVPGRPPGMVSMGFVKVKPGLQIAAVKAELQKTLPDDVEVVTRAELIRQEQARWVSETPIGSIFLSGVVLAVVVGCVVVYQVLSSDVRNHLAEYATLKAMGYGNGFLSWIVIQQAMMLALFAFPPSLLVAFGLYSVTQWSTELPMPMQIWQIGSVAVLSLVMCVASALFASRTVRSLDPAELF